MSKASAITAENFMTSFQKGEERSFTAFFHEFFHPITYYALLITKNQVVAEDIAEEAFMTVWRKRSQFLEPNHLKNYIYTVARNASFAHMNKEKKKRTGNAEYLLISDPVEKDVMEHLIRAEVMREIDNSIEMLAPRMKMVMIHLFRQGKTVRQTALEMNTSIGTVKSQKARALEILRGKLSPMALLLLTGILS